MKILKLTATVLLLGLLGAGCSETPTTPEKKAAVTKVEKVQKAPPTEAEFMTVASAIGALQHCRSTKLYVGSPDIVNDSYYRLAGLLRAAGNDTAHPLHMASLAAEQAYKLSFTGGSFTISTRKDGTLVRDGPKNVSQADTCKQIEKRLIDARQPGNLLDVRPVAPIEPDKQGSIRGDPTIRHG